MNQRTIIIQNKEAVVHKSSIDFIHINHKQINNVEDSKINFNVQNPFHKSNKLQEKHNEAEDINQIENSGSDIDFVVEEFDVTESENLDAQICKPEEDRLSDAFINTVVKHHSINDKNEDFNTNSNQSEINNNQIILKTISLNNKNNDPFQNIKKNKEISSRRKTDSVFQNYMATENPNSKQRYFIRFLFWYRQNAKNSNNIKAAKTNTK